MGKKYIDTSSCKLQTVEKFVVLKESFFYSVMLTASFIKDVKEDPRLLCLQAAFCSSGCVVGREALQLGYLIWEGKRTPRN